MLSSVFVHLIYQLVLGSLSLEVCPWKLLPVYLLYEHLRIYNKNKADCQWDISVLNIP